MATLAIADVPQALADAVDTTSIDALLLSRSPGFEAGDPDESLVETTSLGVAQEVAPLAGHETETTRWALAVRAVALGSALSIEAALYPTQGLEQTGLSRSLETRYRSVLAQLDGTFPDDATGQRESHDPPAPRGRFPVALGYPDPARW